GRPSPLTRSRATCCVTATASSAVSFGRNINAVPPGSNYIDLHPENRDGTANKAYPSNFLRPYLGWGDIHVDEFAATSNYHSAQFKVARRATAGLRLSASYTFST